jgi:hypothetical protein
LEKPISIAFLLYVQNLTNHGILVQWNIKTIKPPRPKMWIHLRQVIDRLELLHDPVWLRGSPYWRHRLGNGYNNSKSGDPLPIPWGQTTIYPLLLFHIRYNLPFSVCFEVYPRPMPMSLSFSTLLHYLWFVFDRWLLANISLSGILLHSLTLKWAGSTHFLVHCSYLHIWGINPFLLTLLLCFSK